MKSAGKRSSRVSVTFAGDDDVVQHIISVEDKDQAQKLRNRKVSFSTGTRKQKILEEEYVEGSSDEDEVYGPSSALEAEGDIHGCDVFQFKRNKKSGQMAQKASESRTPKSSRTQARLQQESPIEEYRVKPLQEIPVPVTPKHTEGTTTPRKSRRNRRPEATTPYRLRKRHDEGNSSEEDSFGSSSDSEGSEEEETATTPSRSRRRKTNDVEFTTNAEEYFDIHSGAAITSDRTLSKLDTPRLDQQALSALLESVSSSHVSECAGLLQEHMALFSKWMFQMCNDFNILLYGLGSKRGLIETFRQKFLHDFSHVVVNGYFPSLTVKQILSCIIDEIIEEEVHIRTPADQYEYIRRHFENSEYRDFYLIIHNIDGSMLRGEKTQNLLSLLAQVRGVHIIASIDHINAPLIWDHTKCCRFNWLCFDTTTYIPYSSETSYENSLLVQQTGALALSSLTHVMKSLTTNAKGIFLLLAKHQQENKENATYIGMSFSELYQRCRESFLVNSDLTLKAQLIEFRDHKLIRSKKSYDGVEHLLIPIDTPTLAEFLEQQEDS
ncbi:origin recognition complex subunit 2-like [Haliotis rufescens]|uniref:origin recognition complex subunit 2-like n=1 Tax=Haliotis rufescens TaxID=6454 RepID=UPI00201F3A48|nr:origin recognition complex subunit 2-like [Haliotis rufescens]